MCCSSVELEVSTSHSNGSYLDWWDSSVPIYVPCGNILLMAYGPRNHISSFPAFPFSSGKICLQDELSDLDLVALGFCMLLFLPFLLLLLSLENILFRFLKSSSPLLSTLGHIWLVQVEIGTDYVFRKCLS